MVESATEFIKAGYSEEESAVLAEVASMFQNVADEELSASEAASFLIAQMAAFNIEAENSEHIINAVNEVANRFAVSSGDISQSLGIMSSALAAGNVSFEESIGLVSRPIKISLIDGEALRAFLTKLF